jgi:hypothetical protein
MDHRNDFRDSMYVTAKKTVSATKFTAIRNGLLIHEQAKELLN